MHETSSGRLSNWILYFKGGEVRSLFHTPCFGEKHGEIQQHLLDKRVFSKVLRFYCLASGILLVSLFLVTIALPISLLCNTTDRRAQAKLRDTNLRQTPD